MLMRLHQLSKYFGDHPIVENIEFTINTQDRIGLVGRNGAGKTTLLRILAGTMDFDSGQRTHKEDLSIVYLQQDIDFQLGRGLFAKMIVVFPELIKMEAWMKEIESLLAEKKLYAGWIVFSAKSASEYKGKQDQEAARW